ncbi:MAG: hypothetical protein IKP64_11290 [Selenomonadaceae bacterium]|nr:hypothetical protein [Selenomonadaceae bacterium]
MMNGDDFGDEPLLTNGVRTPLSKKRGMNGDGLVTNFEAFITAKKQAYTKRLWHFFRFSTLYYYGLHALAKKKKKKGSVILTNKIII